MMTCLDCDTPLPCGCGISSPNLTEHTSAEHLDDDEEKLANEATELNVDNANRSCAVDLCHASGSPPLRLFCMSTKHAH